VHTNIDSAVYDITVASDENTPYHHYFNGPHSIPGAHCPNCDRPLLCFLTLDTRDPRLCMMDMPFSALPLLYCWTCTISFEEFYYRLNADGGGVTLLKYGNGIDANRNFAPDEVPLYFPLSPVELIKMTDEQVAFMDRLRNGETVFAAGDWVDTPTHQLGGLPHLCQGWDDPMFICPMCGKEMPFLAAITDQVFPADIFESALIDIVYSYCADCHVVGAIHQCD